MKIIEHFLKSGTKLQSFRLQDILVVVPQFYEQIQRLKFQLILVPDLCRVL